MVSLISAPLESLLLVDLLVESLLLFCIRNFHTRHYTVEMVVILNWNLAVNILSDALSEQTKNAAKGVLASNLPSYPA